MQLSVRDEKRLAGVHPLLAGIVRRAAGRVPTDDGMSFIVVEGLRSKERQAQLVKAGASKTMNSKHLTGHAVDLAAVLHGEVRWDWPLYSKLAAIMKQVADELSIDLTWGGDWKSFPDGPHFEIDPTRYPV